MNAGYRQFLFSALAVWLHVSLRQFLLQENKLRYYWFNTDLIYYINTKVFFLLLQNGRNTGPFQLVAELFHCPAIKGS